jgi:Tol biopolymer transport system component
MRRTPAVTKRTLMAFVLVAAGCQATPAGTPTRGSASPTTAPTAAPTAVASLVPVPAGRIVFMRPTSDGVEHYFTISSDGTDEREIYTAEGCGCAHWMADGSRVMSLGESGNDVWSLMTIRQDGSNRVVIPTPIKTLSLAVGATSSDGRWVAFQGWDNEHPSRAGLYLARPDLTHLRYVLPLQEGWLAVEPFGVTPDGSKVVFFADTGPDGGTTHAGNAYVVNADGTDLRQLNPTGTNASFIGPPVVSLSPDGRRAAFAASDKVYVADLATGATNPITDQAGTAWAVAWSPTDAWIAYTLNTDGVNTISLVRPDGADRHKIPSSDTSDRASWGVWSSDGKALLVQNDNTRKGGRTDLWVMDLEGTFLGQITHDPSEYGFYSWAPNPD